MELKTILKEGTEQLGIAINDRQAEQFIRYMGLLKEWNERINLTAITDEKEIIIKHFFDCLALVETLEKLNIGSIIDMGTGAGFPGIPVKIIKPDLNVVLADSLNKRLIFLNEVIKELSLVKIDTVHGRAEDLGADKKYREKFDACTSRAVAALPVLSEYCFPLVKVKGYVICMKGKEIETELEGAKKAISLMGGEFESKRVYGLPYSDIEHCVIVMRKLRQTPTLYPRKAGKPAKDPIQ